MLLNKFRLLIAVLFAFISTAVSAQSLEERLKPYWLIPNLDVFSFKAFKDFLIPNEWNPYAIKTHLDLVKKDGLLISTGTERAFIAFALCTKCSGLIGIDINPRVKAYNDFDTLLLKLSKNREDYLQLRGVNASISLLDSHLKTDRPAENLANTLAEKEEAITKLTKIVANRLEEDQQIAPEFKKFYQNNLNNFAKIFYGVQFHDLMLVFIDPEKKNLLTQIEFPLRYFEKANYLFDDFLFARLKKFADAGSLVFVTKNIDDLDFLSQEQIAAIDTSNITDYGTLNFQNLNKNIDKVLIIEANKQHLDVSYKSHYN